MLIIDAEKTHFCLETVLDWHYSEVMWHFDDRRREFTPYGFTCQVWQPRPMSRPDRHDEIEINYLEHGTLTYLIAGKRISVQPRTFTLFWGAIPHQIVASDGAEHYFVVTIPFGWFLRWELPSDFRNQLVMGHVLCEPSDGRVIDDGALFKQWLHDLSTGEQAGEIVLLELKARMLRLAQNAKATSHVSRPASTASAEPPAKLEKAEMMACFIARNYASRIRVKDIAAAVDLHPDYAATLFRQTYGTTLNSLVTRHRIADAQRQLLSGDERIVNVAYAAGFDSLSRFNRAFKQITGQTPRHYRQARNSSH